jgi:hypothetical protein
MTSLGAHSNQLGISCSRSCRGVGSLSLIRKVEFLVLPLIQFLILQISSSHLYIGSFNLALSIVNPLDNTFLRSIQDFRNKEQLYLYDLGGFTIIFLPTVDLYRQRVSNWEKQSLLLSYSIDISKNSSPIARE